jgi:hypothetical protein
MSHYSVAVILPREASAYELESLVDEVLAPFQEGLEVEEYIGYTREDAEKIYFKYTGKKLPKGEEYANIAEDFFGGRIDNQGNILSCSNPQSKWDWYEVGGRWENTVKTKDSRLVNFARIKDIEFKANLTDSQKAELKEKYEKLVSGETHYSPEYILKKYPNFESYLKTQDFSTYAVLDSDGNWHEPGQMGWFGCSTSSPEEEIDFANNYYDLVYKEHPEDWLVVVDCHI